MAGPDLGTSAPDFTLPGWSPSGEQEFALSAHRGRPVVLAFYPGDETAVCTRQLCSYAAGLDALTGLDAVLWGISPQDVTSHRAFAEHRGLSFPLLADTDRSVVASYGIGLPGLGLRRSVFVVDAEGVLRWKRVSLVGLSYRGVEEIAGVLRGLSP